MHYGYKVFWLPGNLSKQIDKYLFIQDILYVQLLNRLYNDK